MSKELDSNNTLRELLNSNKHVELFTFDGTVDVTIKGNAKLTPQFLEAMKQSGYKLQGIFNHVEDVPYKIEESVLEFERKHVIIPSFVNTTFQFKDNKFSPLLEDEGRTDIETCLKSRMLEGGK